MSAWHVDDALTLSATASTWDSERGAWMDESEILTTGLISYDSQGNELELYRLYRGLIESRMWVETDSATHAGYYPNNSYTCKIRLNVTSGPEWYDLFMIDLNKKNVMTSDGKFIQKAGLTFEFRNVLPSPYSMTSDNRGWGYSNLRSDMNPDNLPNPSGNNYQGDNNSIWNLMPEGVSKMMATVGVYAVDQTRGGAHEEQVYYSLDKMHVHGFAQTRTRPGTTSNGETYIFYQGDWQLPTYTGDNNSTNYDYALPAYIKTLNGGTAGAKYYCSTTYGHNGSGVSYTEENGKSRNIQYSLSNDIYVSPVFSF